MSYINIDEGEIIDQISDELIEHEYESRGLGKEDEPLTKLMLEKVYEYLDKEVHTYDDVQRIESLLGI